MARLFALIVLLLLCLTMFGQAAPPDDLSGAYTVDGTNPDNSKYTGTIELTGSGEQWALHWTFQHGEAIGVGIRVRDVLSVIFQTSDGTIGLASFAIDQNAHGEVQLRGRWTVPGTGFVAAEVLTKAAKTRV